MNICLIYFIFLYLWVLIIYSIIHIIEIRQIRISVSEVAIYYFTQLQHIWHKFCYSNCVQLEKFCCRICDTMQKNAPHRFTYTWAVLRCCHATLTLWLWRRNFGMSICVYSGTLSAACSNNGNDYRAGNFRYFFFFSIIKMIFCIFYQANLTGSGLFK